MRFENSQPTSRVVAFMNDAPAASRRTRPRHFSAGNVWPGAQVRGPSWRSVHERRADRPPMEMRKTNAQPERVKRRSGSTSPTPRSYLRALARPVVERNLRRELRVRGASISWRVPLTMLVSGPIRLGVCLPCAATPHPPAARPGPKRHAEDRTSTRLSRVCVRRSRLASVFRKASSKFDSRRLHCRPGAAPGRRAVHRTSLDCAKPPSSSVAILGASTRDNVGNAGAGVLSVVCP
jgi:hypothetical protein